MMACINPTNLLQGFLKPYVKLYSKHQRDVFAYVCEGEERPDIQYARYSDNFVICVHEDKAPVIRQLFDVLAKYGLRVRYTTASRGNMVKACGFNWVVGDGVYPTRAQKRRLRALTYIKNKYNDMLPVHAGVSGWVNCLNHTPKINPTRSTLASVLATYQVAGSESHNDSMILF
ncbi:MAG: hypothetical protein QXS68_08255 [Candidatus Methanomethylicaceae archaeon]